jgi:hypothetical protein
VKERRSLYGRRRPLSLRQRSRYQRIDREAIDMRFERAPTRKAVLPGEGELRVRQPRGGICVLQFFEMAFCLFAEPVEIRLVWKRERVGHGTPSFLLKGNTLSAAHVRKKGKE